MSEVRFPSASAVKRVTIFVGYRCSNDCRFCVVGHKRNRPDKTTDEILRELKEAYDGGAREVVFSGGEFTLRDDAVHFVSRARDLGYRTIHAQTNGRTWSSPEFCKKMLAAGINAFSPALHGHTARVHDFLTRSKGSYRQTVLGIHTMRKIGGASLNILTNTVITKYNYMFLPDIARLLISLGVNQYQFAFVHALGNAGDDFKTVVPRKTDVIPFVKAGLQLGLDAGLRVMAEAIPLCLMQGYESCVSEFYIPSTEVREPGSVTAKFEDVRKHDGKVKFKQCKICRYDGVCEGPWKEYPRQYGDSEFIPICR